MSQRQIPLEVRQAILAGNRETLSELGRRGARVRRFRQDIRERYEERMEELRLLKMLNGSEQMSQEAHEDDCPVN